MNSLKLFNILLDQFATSMKGSYKFVTAVVIITIVKITLY